MVSLCSVMMCMYADDNFARMLRSCILVGEPLMTQPVIEHVASLVEQKGSDVWWLADVDSLLPPDMKEEAHLYSKGLDTMDV